jgi:hypothetical protein
MRIQIPNPVVPNLDVWSNTTSRFGTVSETKDKNRFRRVHEWHSRTSSAIEKIHFEVVSRYPSVHLQIDE